MRKTIFFLRTLAFICVLCATCVPAWGQEVYDPIEPVNRGIFWFNDKVDVYFLEPVAKGYDFVVPTAVQNCLDNFFDNLKFPAFLVSDLIQLKFDQAALHTGRFVINTTLGLGGLFDAAADTGLEPHREDFGTALGYWGVPPGPYLVLPFLGPSNVRDGIGRAVDIVLNPAYWLGATDMHDDTATGISFGLTAVYVVNSRAGLLDAVASAKEASLDYYLFVQSAYYQVRQNLIYDDNPPDSGDDFEDEFEDEFEEEFDEEDGDERTDENSSGEEIGQPAQADGQAKKEEESPAEDVYGDQPSGTSS